MTRGGLQPAKPFFSGSRRLVDADDLDAFVRRAQPEESLVYCEDTDLPRSLTTARVTDLAASGLVRPHRRRRQGGGWEYFVVRTRKGQAAVLDPVQAALADPATDLIFRALKRAANLALPCPSDAALARMGGLNTRDQAQHRFRKLIDAALIESTVAYERGVPSRVVTIAAGSWAGSAGGKSTALPKKWRAMIAAAERELRRAGGGQ